MSLLNTDRISAMMGAPLGNWKPSEVNQIKHIHRCYRNAYSIKVDLNDVVKFHDKPQKDDDLDLGNNVKMSVQKHQPAAAKKQQQQDGDVQEEDLGQEQAAKRDEENFLPRDSVLRSKNGDKKIPQNPAFKDFESFKNSCAFDFWRNHFEMQSTDKFLAETAQTIVYNICNAQSRDELRVRKGAVPFRKHREQITPLALVLHELKLWCTNTLRPANVYNEETFQELRCRIRYVESLAHKEVWGDVSIALGAGMHVLAHDKLFRLLLSTKEALERAEEYSYRGYNRRSSREKLYRVKDLLKDLILNEMRLVSARMTLEFKLEDPRTYRLQPNDLLNSIENQSFVDYKNFVNVMLYKLCENPLVRSALTADYDNPQVKEIIGDIQDWSYNNLFCSPSEDQDDPEPKFKMDKRKEVAIMPEVYATTAASLKVKIREIDPRAPVPDSAHHVVQRLNNAYESMEASAKVMRTVMKNAAAIQDLFPIVYAMFQLWSLAGDGGDFTIYDTMREHVIRVMSDAVNRATNVRKSGRLLALEITKLAEKKEDEMKKTALRQGQMKYKPAWIMNHKFITDELLPNVENVFDNTLARLFEIAKDARDYNLSTDQLNDKVKAAKKVFDAITHFHQPNKVEALVSNDEDFKAPVLSTASVTKPKAKKAEEKSVNVSVSKKEKKQKEDADANPPPMKDFQSDWLQSNREVEVDMSEFGANNAFGDRSTPNAGGKKGNYAMNNADDDSDDY